MSLSYYTDNLVFFIDLSKDIQTLLYMYYSISLNVGCNWHIFAALAPIISHLQKTGPGSSCLSKPAERKPLHWLARFKLEMFPLLYWLFTLSHN